MGFCSFRPPLAAYGDAEVTTLLWHNLEPMMRQAPGVKGIDHIFRLRFTRVTKDLCYFCYSWSCRKSMLCWKKQKFASINPSCNSSTTCYSWSFIHVRNLVVLGATREHASARHLSRTWVIFQNSKPKLWDSHIAWSKNLTAWLSETDNYVMNFVWDYPMNGDVNTNLRSQRQPEMVH